VHDLFCFDRIVKAFLTCFGLVGVNMDTPLVFKVRISSSVLAIVVFTFLLSSLGFLGNRGPLLRVMLVIVLVSIISYTHTQREMYTHKKNIDNLVIVLLF
jgi:hypothetical protein